VNEIDSDGCPEKAQHTLGVVARKAGLLDGGPAARAQARQNKRALELRAGYRQLVVDAVQVAARDDAPGAAGRVFNVGCGGTHDLLELLDRVCDAVGRRVVDAVMLSEAAVAGKLEIRADATLDLSTCCSPPAAPCNGKTPAAPPAQGLNDLQSFGPFTLPKAQVQAVDVLIRYKETQSDPKSGLSRAGCSGATACEYTRTHEDYELYCNPVEDCDDPTDKHAYDWYKAYEEGRAKLLETLERLRSDADPLRTAARLLQWLRQNPPRSFCFLCDYLCDLQTTGKFPENWFNELAFWIVQDWRISYLHCLCDGCGPETGVRLARVWLWRRTDNQGKQQLKVVYINEYPPFRRPVKRECWPAPAGPRRLNTTLNFACPR